MRTLENKRAKRFQSVGFNSIRCARPMSVSRSFPIRLGWPLRKREAQADFLVK